jgi:tetratricopeptide (TPR) repeat protein
LHLTLDAQIQSLLSDAPASQAADSMRSGHIEDADEETVNQWCRTLIRIGRYEQCEKFADNVDSEVTLCEIRSAMAEEYSKRGNSEKTAACLKQALKASADLRFPDSRCIPFCHMAKALRVTGQADEANRLLDEASANALRIDEVHFKSTVLAIVAMALIQAARVDDALKLPGEVPLSQILPTYYYEPAIDALKMVKEHDKANAVLDKYFQNFVRYPDPVARTEFLTTVARKLQDGGNHNGARRFHDEAVSLARRLEQKSSRAVYLISAAETLAKAGRASDAIALAREVRDSSSNKQAHAVVVRSLLQAGQLDSVRGVLHEALVASQQIDDEDRRAWSLLQIALAELQLGRRQEGRKHLEEAISISYIIPDESKKSLSLIQMSVLGLNQLREFTRAQKLLMQSREIAGGVSDDDDRDRAFYSVAIGLASMKSFRLARLTADKCTSSKTRLSAYIVTLKSIYGLDAETGYRRVDQE